MGELWRQNWIGSSEKREEGNKEEKEIKKDFIFVLIFILVVVGVTVWYLNQDKDTEYTDFNMSDLNYVVVTEKFSDIKVMDYELQLRQLTQLQT